MDGFAVLRENCHDVTFGEIEGKATNVDISRIAIIRMPGSFGRSAIGRSVLAKGNCVSGMRGRLVHGVFQFALVERLNLTDGVHRDSKGRETLCRDRRGVCVGEKHP